MGEQILALHNQGLNYNQIANALGCSRLTVRYHLNPQDKINAKTRVELSRAKKAKAKVKTKETFVIVTTPKKEVKIKPEKVKSAKKERKADNNKNASDPKKRVFKNRDLGLKEKIAVNLMDNKNTIVYTTNPKYNLKELQLKFLKKVI
jgi:DNA-binding CsgD family transcriptional regulator